MGTFKVSPHAEWEKGLHDLNIQREARVRVAALETDFFEKELSALDTANELFYLLNTLANYNLINMPWHTPSDKEETNYTIFTRILTLWEEIVIILKEETVDMEAPTVFGSFNAELQGLMEESNNNIKKEETK